MTDLPTYTASDLDHLNGLSFPSFTNEDAVALGLVAVEVIRERDLSLAVEIRRGEDVLFVAKLKETGPGNDPWLAGKAAVVRRFGKPSLQLKLEHLETGSPFEDRTDVDHELLKAHGGCIPLRVGGEIVGTLTMSGEPDVIDHQVAAEAIERYLGRLAR